jgi:hypothetical protein
MRSAFRQQFSLVSSWIPAHSDLYAKTRRWTVTLTNKLKDKYYTRSANDRLIFKIIGTCISLSSSSSYHLLNLDLPRKVYSMVFIAMAESAAEGTVAYTFLNSYWGNPLLLEDAPFAIQVLNDLQPLFDAIRNCFQSCNCNLMLTFHPLR